MKRLDQSGIAHLAVLVLVVFVLGAVGFVGWKVLKSSEDKSPASSGKASKQETNQDDSLALQNLGLQSFEDIDYNQNAVREYKSNGLKGFYAFGEKLSGNRLNPNFEYASVKQGAKVVSAIDGMVVDVKEQPDSKDYEVFVIPKDGSKWVIGYDHLTNVVVKRGSSVKAGEVLGEPAPQNNGLLRFELQVNEEKDGQTTHHCPTTLLAEGVREEMLSGLTLMQTKWESTTGLELYNTATQNPIGCVKTTLSVAEAEGR